MSSSALLLKVKVSSKALAAMKSLLVYDKRSCFYERHFHHIDENPLNDENVADILFIRRPLISNHHVVFTFLSRGLRSN